MLRPLPPQVIQKIQVTTIIISWQSSDLIFPAEEDDDVIIIIIYRIYNYFQMLIIIMFLNVNYY